MIVNDKSINVTKEIIERDCLSVLHKLHDQLNGLQLVQVVVQPLARLFNPALSTSSASATTSTYMMSPDTAQALIARLDTDRDVNWLMEIIGYGLSVPFSLTQEHDCVKDCCTIYCEWLSSSLLPYNESNEDDKYQQLSKLVPVPIRSDPNRYARKILSHLYNVFLPRQPVSLPASSNQKQQEQMADTNLAVVSRQAVLCHRVLRTIESIAHNTTNLMDHETWHHLLALLLTVNDKLLSPPTEPDDIGTQLNDRTLGTLFNLMLLACSKSIPDSNTWKTFHQMCLNWRHRPALIDHWRRLILMLTQRIVQFSSKSHKMCSSDSDPITFQCDQPSNNNAINSSIKSSIGEMSYETLSQTWYWFLNLIGNPVELSEPSIISRTEEFYQAACSSNNVLDPRQHPCLNVLPQVFLNSMLGIRDVVDCFLGVYQPNQQDQEKDRHPMEAHTPDKPHVQVTTPTQARRAGGLKSLGIKSARSSTSGPSESHGYITNPSVDSPSIDQSRSGSVSSSSRQTMFAQPRPSITSITSRLTLSETQQQYQPLKQKLSPERPKCNSLLHILGNWLFNAALIGSELNEEKTQRDSNEEVTDESMTSALSTSTATEVGSTSRGHSPALSRKQSSQQSQSSHTSSSMLGQQSARQHDTSGSSGGWITLDPPLSADSFEQGQAEAMAIMCKIFSSKRSNEDISRGHLARFYLSLQHCLTFATGQHQTRPPHQSYPIKRQLLASVLNSSTSLLQSDLDGINLLIPHFLRAIEFVFECSDREPIQAPPRQHSKQGSTRHSQSANSAQNLELRRSCICTLVNLLAYPFHFQDLVIRDCLNETSPSITFGSLRNRLFKLLFVALQTENDQTNMQILFGGLSLAVHDLSCNLKPPNKSVDEHKSGGDSDLPAQKIDTTNQKSFVFSSKEGFLIKSLHVTCHLLISTWKHDNLVSLAALELLATIARVSSQSLDKKGDPTGATPNDYPQIEMKNEYMQTTKWICDYICNQCSRPPPAHSRDMHSTIVAAYQCLAVWFYNHPYLLSDENSVQTVLEVIELGVSGQKSKAMNFDPSSGVTSHTIISKGEKEMRPSSLRVRDAAESLLNVCMTCTSGAGFAYETQETGIVELVLGGAKFKTITRNIQDPELRQIEAYKMFKYFSDDDSILFGLFEGQDAPYKDSMICLIRTPFGRHCWRMKFNYYSSKCKNKIIANKTLGLIKRPFQQCSTPSTDGKSFSFPKGHNKSLYFNNSARFFPESLDHVQSTVLDKQVTTLNEYIQETNRNNSRFKTDFDKINKIFSQQVLAEQQVINECSSRLKRIDCEEPQQMTDLETARVLVAHLGLRISLNSLVSGEKISPGFVKDLKHIDELPVNICDNINVFYVRRNKTSLPEILESVQERHNVTLEFFEWLLELGKPILMTDLIKGSAGSDVNMSDKFSKATRNEMLMLDHGGAVFDGKRMILHWNDMCQELKFTAPSRVDEFDSNIMVFWLESQDDIANIPFEALSFTLVDDKVREHHQEFQLNITGAINPNSSNSSSENSPTVVPTSHRPFNLTSKTRGEFARYFISPMRNGLYCVNLITSLGRPWLALPLVDEMTVNKAMLSSLIRESILNFCRRKRLDADSYQPPHVRRRIKLQDLCSHHGISSRHEPSEFYNNLYRNIKNHSSSTLTSN